jgi:hypothetical protein
MKPRVPWSNPIMLASVELSTCWFPGYETPTHRNFTRFKSEFVCSGHT